MSLTKYLTVFDDYKRIAIYQAKVDFFSFFSQVNEEFCIALKEEASKEASSLVPLRNDKEVSIYDN